MHSSELPVVPSAVLKELVLVKSVAIIAEIQTREQERVALKGQVWLNQWQEAVDATAQALKQAWQAGELVFSSRAETSWATGGSPRWHQPWPILESYVHMTNNRLGILNQDETYLGYLIQGTVPFLTGRTNNRFP